jgi:hypothetical protein
MSTLKENIPDFWSYLPSGAASISLTVRLNTLVVGAAFISQSISRTYSCGFLLHEGRAKDTAFGTFVGVADGDGPLVGDVDDAPTVFPEPWCFNPNPNPKPRLKARTAKTTVAPINKTVLVNPWPFDPACFSLTSTGGDTSFIFTATASLRNIDLERRQYGASYYESLVECVQENARPKRVQRRRILAPRNYIQSRELIGLR